MQRKYKIRVESTVDSTYATASSIITLGPKKVTRATESLALFRRICILPHSDALLENNFQFELSPYLLSYSTKRACKKQGNPNSTQFCRNVMSICHQKTNL